MFNLNMKMHLEEYNYVIYILIQKENKQNIYSLLVKQQLKKS